VERKYFSGRSPHERWGPALLALHVSIRFAVRDGFRSFGFGAGVFHSVLESAEAFADPLAEFRQFLGTENKQSDKEDDQQVHRLKQAFHKNPRADEYQP